MSVWRSEADSRCRSAVQLKAVLTVEQAGGQQGALVLWGAAVDWLHRLSRDRGTHTHTEDDDEVLMKHVAAQMYETE